ncbi:MAG: DUF6492 family protein [Ancalomicrobiaceae bacterium]|nr:DUF6492 family protein [Ancalomicrobiaceae bacterium]
MISDRAPTPAVPDEAGPTAAILTCSFRGDFDHCRLLCESVDRFVAEPIEHRLYVPTADLGLFAALEGGRRKIVSEDTLLPWWMKRLPMPPPKWRKFFGLPRRNLYLTPFSAPVRGWIAQQMMKIAAALQATTDVVVHVDSDTVFIRPLHIDRLIRADGRARLYQSPGHQKLDSHRGWHRAASKLFGLRPDEFHSGDYIDSLVVWRPDVVRAMAGRIAEVGGRDWRNVLARQQQISEYILYGVFADQVLGLDAARLVAEPFTLCHSKWTGDFSADGAIEDFVAALRPEHVVCLIQSTIPLSMDERRALLARIADHAAASDAA